MKRDAKIFFIIWICFLIIGGLILYLNQSQGYIIFSNPQLNETYVTFRFDDGLASQKQAFDVLKENNLTGSLYVIVNRINLSDDIDKGYYLDWNEIKNLSEFMEIGSHSLNHFDLTKSKDYKKEIIESKTALLERGFNVTTFVYPGGNYDSWVLRVVKDNYDCASSQDVGTNWIPLREYALKDFTFRDKNDIDTIKRVIKPGKWNILAFHDINLKDPDIAAKIKPFSDYAGATYANDISLEYFKKIVSYVKENNYTVITINDGCGRFKDGTEY
jgi:peptidoglycan/xylan/chitin deacetylase (PgdA/CDA1 family)